MFNFPFDGDGEMLRFFCNAVESGCSSVIPALAITFATASLTLGEDDGTVNDASFSAVSYTHLTLPTILRV